MAVDPWDFTSIVTAPYLAIFLLMMRRHLRKDRSGNRQAPADPFIWIALALAGAAIVVPGLFIALGIAHVFIPYGSVGVGMLGLIWLAWAISLQRRPPPEPVKSTEIRPATQQRTTDARQRRPQMHPPRRPGP